MSQIYKAATGGSLPPSVAQSFITNPLTGVAVPAAGVLTFANGNGIVFSAFGSTVTASVVTDGFPWTDEAVTFSAMPQNGYFCTGTLTCNLPTAGLVNGSTIILYVDSASVVTVQAAAGQQINIGADLSSVAGTAASTAEGSTLTLTYRVADTSWHAISSLGSWTLA